MTLAVSHPNLQGMTGARGRGLRARDTDGRRLSRERNRLAVVDALLDLYAEGNLRPGAQEVADRSGVSRRSVFRYFQDLEDLDRTAIHRQQERVRELVEPPPSGESLDERLAAIAAQRVCLYEAIFPAARVARLRAPFHPVIAEELAASRRYLARQVEVQFAPELAAIEPARRQTLSAAAEALCSFEVYELWRARGIPPPAIEEVIRAALSRLLAVNS